jgi:hypothetical protein
VVTGLFLLSMAIPSGMILTHSNHPLPLPSPDHDSIVHFSTDSPRSVGVGLVFASLCTAIILMQRGQKDRYDPLVLSAFTLTILGMVMAFDAAIEVMNYGGDWRPIGLARLSIAVLAASGGLALIRAIALLVKRSSRRGVVLALFVLLYSPWACWLTYYVLHPPPLYSIEGSIEVPRVGDHGGWYSYPEDYELRIDREGRILRHQEVVWSPESPEGDSVLRRVLTEISHNDSGDMFPEELVQLCADRRAPFGAINRVLTMCAEEGIGIGRVFFVIERVRVQQPGTFNLGLLELFIPRATDTGDAATDVTPESVVEILRGEGPDGESRGVYRYMGEQTSDVGDLRKRISAQYAVNRYLRLVFRADVRLAWDRVAQAMSAGAMIARRNPVGLGALGPGARLHE